MSIKSRTVGSSRQFVLVSVDSALRWQVERIFRRSFPIHERLSLRPYFEQRRGVAFVYALVQYGRVLGFATLLRYSGFTYIFYLAADPNRKGRGVGTEIVRNIFKLAEGDTIFLHSEVVCGNRQECFVRQRRVNFYLRLGFRACGVPHVWRGEKFQTYCIGEDVCSLDMTRFWLQFERIQDKRSK